MNNRKLPAAEVEFIDRGPFKAAVSADTAAVAAQHAKDADDWKAGHRPF